MKESRCLDRRRIHMRRRGDELSGPAKTTPLYRIMPDVPSDDTRTVFTAASHVQCAGDFIHATAGAKVAAERGPPADNLASA